jgi:hypothetical protein
MIRGQSKYNSTSWQPGARVNQKICLFPLTTNQARVNIFGATAFGGITGDIGKSAGLFTGGTCSRRN